MQTATMKMGKRGMGASARTGLGLAALLLLFSGAASLIFQIVWIKQLSLVVGVEIHAIATAVSAFFLGLAAGGWLLGRLAARLSRPIRLYAALEAGVALLGLAVTGLLAHGAPWFAAYEGPLAWLALFLAVGAAPFLMGGTLPALLQALRAAGPVARSGGTLYAANTAGAIAGALLPAFALIPALGVMGTACAAAALNLVSALGALGLDRAVPAPEPARAAPLEREARWAIGLYTLAGALALGYEILWAQMVVPFMSTRAFAFSIVLAIYLAGLAAGSAAYARWGERLGEPWRVFGWLIALAGVTALLEAALLGRWLVPLQSLAEAGVLRWTDNRLAGMSARFATAGAAVVLLPTFLLGAAFPAVLRIAAGRDGQAGRRAGAVLAGNTLGGIAGTLLTGFVLLPALGAVRTLAVLAAGACALGLAALWRAPGGMLLGRASALALLLGTAGVGAALPADHLARLLPGAQGADLVFYQENHGGTVAVVERGEGERRFRRLYIQGVSNSGDAMPSLRYMRLQALLPLIIHNGEPRSALVIGYGTGITAGALSRYAGLRQRVVAELLPAVVQAGPLFRGTYGASQDPGLEIRLRDGRRELLASEQRYDLITLEPPPPSAAGVVNLYSSDFYALAARRLNPSGVVAQWLPLPTQNLEDTRALVASFLAVFPHVSLWTTEVHEMLLVGSMQPMALDAARIAERFGQPRVQEALAEVGVRSPAALLATWVCGREALEGFVAGVAPVTDDRPAIEYAPWVRQREIVRALPALMALREAPPLQGGSPQLDEAMRRERVQLDLFYRSTIAAYAGDQEGWSRDVIALSRLADGNRYLRWFLDQGTGR
ncbi:fused MFS/spermidine synthase [Bordetella pseudohinzii]|uniref:Spermidine synthase n=1 Tax=Bordetella pseudohinzii TaxID=1331258 RepID=A0A0J6C3K0_9BORD|nr:spermidine synthase [Bordetella pseudohinzii]KMM25346.1 spermidine synthase [Bordetella pseudohinzii]KXA75996.1 spermidine synthase [Bordetella pseudohinzii]KXA81238.1 spermidine synthase [Bordetella pseudohinzii]CUJ04361.1 spermidine synthase [Bordetella pseudohinzii]